jgi:hypothetical protein
VRELGDSSAIKMKLINLFGEIVVDVLRLLKMVTRKRLR